MSGHTPGRFRPYEGDEPFIFVCCAHVDMEEVYPDIEHLHNAGYRIWYDEGVDESEDSYKRVIQKIAACSYFLAFLSPRALESGFVPREVLFALEKKKPILAVYLSELNLTSQLELPLITTLKLKRYEQSKGEYLRQLMRSVPEEKRSPSIDEEFKLMIESRINQAGGSWNEELNASLTFGAELLGLEPERARKILDERLEELGLTGEYERLRKLVIESRIDQAGGSWNEAQSDAGRTALMYAATAGHAETVKALLDEDSVYTTVFAPPSVTQGETFLAQVFAHLPQQAGEAKELAAEFDPDSQRRGVKNLETKIARGTKLTFDLVMRGLEIDDPVQSLIWNGRPEAVQFGVTVPSEHRIGTVIGTVTVSQDSVPIGHIKFKLAITAASMTQSTQEAEPVGDDARRYTKAFVSYASKDLDKVRPRLQMLSLQGIDYFQDKFGLEPGDRWEKKLYVNIDQCDLFLLFWSSAAKESEWVRKEVNYALDRKGGDDFAPPEIHPVVIEGPPVPDPWQEVSHIHFDDWRIHYHA